MLSLIFGAFFVIMSLCLAGLAFYVVGSFMDEFYPRSRLVMPLALAAAVAFPVLCYMIGQVVIPS